MFARQKCRPDSAALAMLVVALGSTVLAAAAAGAVALVVYPPGGGARVGPVVLALADVADDDVVLETPLAR